MQRRFFAWLAAEGREEQFGEGMPYGPDGTFSRRETYALIAILRTGATPVQRWNAAYVLSHPTGDRRSTEALRREAYAARSPIDPRTGSCAAARPRRLAYVTPRIGAGLGAARLCQRPPPQPPGLCAAACARRRSGSARARGLRVRARLARRPAGAGRCSRRCSTTTDATAASWSRRSRATRWRRSPASCPRGRGTSASAPRSPRSTRPRACPVRRLTWRSARDSRASPASRRMPSYSRRRSLTTITTGAPGASEPATCARAVAHVRAVGGDCSAARAPRPRGPISSGARDSRPSSSKAYACCAW